MATAKEAKVFFSDICDVKDEYYGQPKRSTEKGGDLIRLDKDINLASNKQQSFQEDVIDPWKTNFTFEKGKMSKVQIEDTTFDVNDTNIQKLKNDTLKQFKDSFNLMENTGKITKMTGILFIFLDIIEMICIALLIYYLAIKSVQIEKLLIWITVGLICCFLQLLTLIKINSNAGSKEANLHKDLVFISHMFSAFLLCVNAITLIDILLDEGSMTGNLTEDARKINELFQKFLILSTTIKLAFHILFALTEKKQINLMTQISEIGIQTMATPRPLI